VRKSYNKNGCLLCRRFRYNHTSGNGLEECNGDFDQKSRDAEEKATVSTYDRTNSHRQSFVDRTAEHDSTKFLAVEHRQIRTIDASPLCHLQRSVDILEISWKSDPQKVKIALIGILAEYRQSKFS